MKLVLAEKPSVAQSIAKVLGAAKREDGYLEGNGYVVSWCVGHLVELAQPEVYDAKYSKWAYADLPIFPMDWQYEVSAGTKKQFGILKKLMAREDVASLVCATDAGREGELIFRLVYHKAGCRKPFERLWISSMEDVAIKEGFENLRSGTEYDALYEAALCRERADWIVGINATRLFSTLYGQTLNVGRVMTPTLAMAVMREAAISAFKPELFYTVQIGLDGFTAASERFKTKAAAEAVKQSCSVAIVQKAECKEKTEKPPALYDLTSLQREANRVLGYTAQQTLDYTQNLYRRKWNFSDSLHCSYCCWCVFAPEEHNQKVIRGGNRMKKLSTIFAVLAILLSDVMCAVVAYNYCALEWGGKYEAWSAPASTALLLAIPYAIGIIICVVLAIVFKRKYM